MYWLGVDGGGTKTRFELFDDEMHSLASLRLPTCHPAQVGYQGMENVLAEGIDLLSSHARDGQIGLGFGLAGYGADSQARRRIGEVVRRIAGDRPFELVSDVRAAWASSLDACDGVAVICGTGSIAYAVKGGRERRAGGWGAQIGDEGSGWWMGRELLRLFSRQADGRDARGPLLEVVMGRLELSDPYDLVAYARDELQGDRARIAALTPVLREAAKAGDEGALGIYQRAAGELAAIVRTAADGLFESGEMIPVGCVGGVFEGAGELLLNPLREQLPGGFDLREPLHAPTAGPCLLLRRRLHLG